MDLSTVEERLHEAQYQAPKDLVDDVKLIYSNCRKYNDETTVYSKCSVKLEKYMWSLIKEIPEWYELLEEWIGIDTNPSHEHLFQDYLVGKFHVERFMLSCMASTWAEDVYRLIVDWSLYIERDGKQVHI